jgi:hypothetical protein
VFVPFFFYFYFYFLKKTPDMKVVDRYSLGQSFSILHANLKHLSLTEDFLSFHITIYQSIQLLNQINQVIRDRRNFNLFGSKIPTMLLGQIFSFLPSTSYQDGYICKHWFQILKLPVIQKIVLAKRRCIGASYISCWKTKCKPYAIAICEKKFLVPGINGNLEIVDIKTGQVTETQTIESEIMRMAASDQHICFHLKNNYLRVVTKENKFIAEWKIWECRGIAIKNDFIYISSCSLFSLYSLTGTLICSWKLKDNNKEFVHPRKIAVYQDDIFMVDTAFSCVIVFSHDGTILREWKINGKNSRPWGIAVTNDTVYVVNSRNNRIIAFTHQGQYLHNIKYSRAQDLSEIYVVKNMLYISDWEANAIFIFQLKYI